MNDLRERLVRCSLGLISDVEIVDAILAEIDAAGYDIVKRVEPPCEYTEDDDGDSAWGAMP